MDINKGKVIKIQNKEKRNVDKILEKYYNHFQKKFGINNAENNDKKLEKLHTPNCKKDLKFDFNHINQKPSPIIGKFDFQSNIIKDLNKNISKSNDNNQDDNKNLFKFKIKKTPIPIKNTNQKDKPINRNKSPIMKIPELIKFNVKDNPPKDSNYILVQKNKMNNPKLVKKYKSPQRKVNHKEILRNLKPFLKKNKIQIFKQQFEKTKHVINQKTLKRSITSIFLPYKNYFYLEDKNEQCQREMEDFHFICDGLGSDENASFFGIFDGHGGTFSAKYCQENLSTELGIESNKCKNNDFASCIKKTFININEKLIKELKEDENCGTTASIAVIKKEKLLNGNYGRFIYTGNVGDSKIYLLQKSGKIIKMSQDHNCKDPNEVNRVKEKGGLVFNFRVFGSLAITRTIGDKAYKEYGVTAEPSIFTHKIVENDNYLILASDGIWDVVSENDLDVFAKEDLGAEALCLKLMNHAKKGGSSDNISCIVIKL